MISANLACALAHASDERVLLVEGDLRRPSLSHMFGIRKSLEYMNGYGKTATRFRISTISRMQAFGFCRLETLQAIRSSYLQSQRLPALMDRVAALFDWIIIDSPPVLPLADTSVWMRLADGVLLVTRQGTTEKQQLQKGLEALESKKLIGALLNGSIASAYSGYYYTSATSS